MDMLKSNTSIADPGAGLGAMMYYNPYHPRFWRQIKSVLAEGYALMARLYPGRHYPMDDVSLFTRVDREGHVVLIIGYDDQTQEVLFLDPWNQQAWGGTRGGITRLKDDIFTCSIVDNTLDLVVLPNPWKVTLTLLPEPGPLQTIAARVEYPCPEPFSAPELVATQCVARLELPEGLELDGSPAEQVLPNCLAPGQTQLLHWSVRQTADVNGTVSVRVRGLISASTPYRYSDIIGIQGEALVCAPLPLVTAQKASIEN